MTADQPPLPGMTSKSEHEADLRSRGDDPTPRLELPGTFMSRVNMSGPAGCWLWTGRTQKGYGVLTIAGRATRAHRAMFEAAVGRIGDDNHVHHKCHQRSCVNPDHLEQHTALTHARVHAASRSTCASGHEYTDANTYTEPGGTRRCRECARVRDRRHHHKHKSPDCQRPAADRTHCPRGHGYSGSNLYVDPDGHRHCRACRRLLDERNGR